MIALGGLFGFFLIKKHQKALEGADCGDKNSVQDFLEFKDIKNGIITLQNNDYRLILEVTGTLNFFLMSEEEQDKAEANFRSLLGSLTFPIQFYTQTRLLDLSNEVLQIRSGLSNLPERLRIYGMQMSEDMQRWMGSKNVMLKRNYIVIPYQNDDYQEAVRELSRRKDIIVSELSKWIDCKPLNTLEVLEVFYVMYNKSKAVSSRIEDAEEFGFTETYVKGVRINDIREMAKEAAGY
jgi:hypothetical protein